MSSRPQSLRPSRSGWARGGAQVLLLWLWSSALGCAQPEHSLPAELLELERLAFVALSRPSNLTGARALLVSRYEVTRGEFEGWVRQRAEPPDAHLAQRLALWDDATGDWPATFVTLDEARDFAHARGLRLPTQDEWLQVACGPTPWDFPWGPLSQQGRANTLELDLRRPCPVGTFEAGASPGGVYDLLGNVCEWVWPSSLREEFESSWALGGSFRSRQRSLWRADPGMGYQLHRAARADDVGFRCVVDAPEYLWARTAPLSDGPRMRARLQRLGRDWGRAAVPLLEELCARAAAPPALAQLLEGARS
jgi:hypothetical protein